jgi:hypothetical protein
MCRLVESQSPTAFRKAKEEDHDCFWFREVLMMADLKKRKTLVLCASLCSKQQGSKWRRPLLVSRVCESRLLQVTLCSSPQDCQQQEILCRDWCSSKRMTHPAPRLPIVERMTRWSHSRSFIATEPLLTPLKSSSRHNFSGGCYRQHSVSLEREIIKIASVLWMKADLHHQLSECFRQSANFEIMLKSL